MIVQIVAQLFETVCIVCALQRVVTLIQNHIYFTFTRQVRTVVAERTIQTQLSANY
jgi:hypothetical protein